MPSDSPEVHPLHKAHGRAWPEVILSVAALLTSAVSVYIAVQHGRVMEKMLEANSLPFLSIYSGDFVENQHIAHVTLRNEGVGPLRLINLRFTLDGKTLHNLQDFLDICCHGKISGEGLATSSAYERFIPARGATELFSYRQQGADDPYWHDFDMARSRIEADACYCSVFTDCYRYHGGAAFAEPAAPCKPDDANMFVP